MNNGGFTPKIRPGEVARLERTLDRIDNGEAPELIHKWVDRQTERLGTQGFHQWLTQRATEDLGVTLENRLHHAMLATLPDKTREMVFDEAQSVMLRDLIEQGFKPGVDFSRTEDGLMISDSAKEYLFSHVPVELHDQIMDKCTVKPLDDPWCLLEDRLGIPFRKNLLARIDELINASTPPEALACWLANVNAGVSHQIMGDPDNIALMTIMLASIHQKHPETYERILAVGEAEADWSVEQLMDFGICPMTDVLRAAGGSSENGCLSSDGQFYSRKGLELMSLVWRGDRHSVNEVVAAMAQLESHD